MNRWWRTALIACFAFCVTAGALLAADAPSPMQPVVDELTRALGQLLALAAGALVTWCLALVRAKLSVSVSSAQEEHLRQLALDAASYAESWGAGQLKMRGAAATSDAKMRQAVAWLGAKLPALSDEQRRQAVEAMLPFLRGQLLRLAKLATSRIPSSLPSTDPEA